MHSIIGARVLGRKLTARWPLDGRLGQPISTTDVVDVANPTHGGLDGDRDRQRVDLVPPARSAVAGRPDGDPLEPWCPARRADFDKGPGQPGCTRNLWTPSAAHTPTATATAGVTSSIGCTAPLPRRSDDLT